MVGSSCGLTPGGLVLGRSFDELDWPDEVIRAVARIRTMVRDQYRLMQADLVELQGEGD